jgi:hypothetical protein
VREREGKEMRRGEEGREEGREGGMEDKEITCIGKRKGKAGRNEKRNDGESRGDFCVFT